MRARAVFERVRSVESAAIAGVVYAVLAVVALGLLIQFPELRQSDAEISAWFDDGANRATLLLGLNLAAISSIAFLWFVAVIRRRLGDREDRFFSTVFLGSAIVYVGAWLSGAAILAAGAVAYQLFDAAAIGRDTATLAGGFAGALLLVAGPRVQAVFVFTTSTLILRSGVLPRWLGYFGYAMGVFLFTVPLVTQPLGIGFPFWVLVVSIIILLTKAGDRGRAPGEAGSSSSAP